MVVCLSAGGGGLQVQRQAGARVPLEHPSAEEDGGSAETVHAGQREQALGIQAGRQALAIGQAGQEPVQEQVGRHPAKAGGGLPPSAAAATATTTAAAAERAGARTRGTVALLLRPCRQEDGHAQAAGRQREAARHVRLGEEQVTRLLPEAAAVTRRLVPDQSP